MDCSRISNPLVAGSNPAQGMFVLFFLDLHGDYFLFVQQMEEQKTLAIPPGIVPSESKEDLYRKLCSEKNEGNTAILKDVTITFIPMCMPLLHVV